MRKNIFARLLFFIYFIFLIWLVIFKFNFSLASIHKVRDVNLIPFYYENVIEGDIPLFEALLNVIVFVPLGFFLHKAFKWKVYSKILFVFGLSFVFEVIQYILAIGATDITDLITNTIGGIIGIGIFSLFQRGKR